MSQWIYLCLSDLLDQDISSYELFQTLPDSTKARAKNADIRSFAELQRFAAAPPREGWPNVL